MDQQALNFTSINDTLIQLSDITRNRHRDNPQSNAAHERIVHTKEDTYKRILKYVDSVGRATSKEIAAALGYGKEMHRISGRLSELKAMNRLRGTGESREGAEVLELVKQEKNSGIPRG